MEIATDMIDVVSTLRGQDCRLQSLTPFKKFGFAHKHAISWEAQPRDGPLFNPLLMQVLWVQVLANATIPFSRRGGQIPHKVADC